MLPVAHAALEWQKQKLQQLQLCSFQPQVKMRLILQKSVNCGSVLKNWTARILHLGLPSRHAALLLSSVDFSTGLDCRHLNNDVMKAVCTFPEQNTVLCGHASGACFCLNKSPKCSRTQRFVFIHYPPKREKTKKKRRILVPLLTVCLQLAAFCNRLQILHWQSVNLSSEARDEWHCLFQHIITVVLAPASPVKSCYVRACGRGCIYLRSWRDLLLHP